MTCCICKVKCNKRLWKRGRERWAYETYQRVTGGRIYKRWFCEKHLDTDIEGESHALDVAAEVRAL